MTVNGFLTDVEDAKGHHKISVMIFMWTTLPSHFIFYSCFYLAALFTFMEFSIVWITQSDFLQTKSYRLFFFLKGFFSSFVFNHSKHTVSLGFFSNGINLYFFFNKNLSLSFFPPPPCLLPFKPYRGGTAACYRRWVSVHAYLFSGQPPVLGRLPAGESGLQSLTFKYSAVSVKVSIDFNGICSRALPLSVTLFSA